MPRPYLLVEAARDNCTLRVRCRSCGRIAAFIAADLVPLHSPRAEVQLLPFSCSHCPEAPVLIRAYTISEADHGRVVLRPVGRKLHTVWQSFRLGPGGVPEAKPELNGQTSKG
jgi:hypothetical protein